jgi:hypothetical protein
MTEEGRTVSAGIQAIPTDAIDHTLAELEATIERGLATFVLVGQALLEIRRRRLYREAGYGDFDAYCRERWGWKRARADQMIRAAETVALLDTTVSSPPANEAQARELARIEDPERVTEVWQEATERYGERVTAEKVRVVVEEFAPETITPAVVLAADPDDGLVLAEVGQRERERAALLDALWRIVQAAQVALKFADEGLAPRVESLLADAEGLLKEAEEAG